MLKGKWRKADFAPWMALLRRRREKREGGESHANKRESESEKRNEEREGGANA